MKLLLPSTTSANWTFNNFCVPVNALLDRNIVYPVNQPPRPSQLWSLYMLCSFLPQQDWLCDPSQRVSIFLSLFLFLYSIKTSFLGPLNGDCPFHEVFKKKKKNVFASPNCLLCESCSVAPDSLWPHGLHMTNMLKHRSQDTLSCPGVRNISWEEAWNGETGAGLTWGGGIALREHWHMSSRPTGWGRGPREARDWWG